MLSEISQTQRTNPVWSHLHEAPAIDKFTDSITEMARGSAEGNRGRSLLMGTEFRFEMMEISGRGWRWCLRVMNVLNAINCLLKTKCTILCSVLSIKKMKTKSKAKEWLFRSPVLWTILAPWAGGESQAKGRSILATLQKCKAVSLCKASEPWAVGSACSVGVGAGWWGVVLLTRSSTVPFPSTPGPQPAETEVTPSVSGQDLGDWIPVPPASP